MLYVLYSKAQPREIDTGLERRIDSLMSRSCTGKIIYLRKGKKRKLYFTSLHSRVQFRVYVFCGAEWEDHLLRCVILNASKLTNSDWIERAWWLLARHVFLYCFKWEVTKPELFFRISKKVYKISAFRFLNLISRVQKMAYNKQCKFKSVYLFVF